MLFLIIYFVIAVMVSSIPQSIVQQKGYNGGGWFIYAVFLFPIAIIHALALPDKKSNELAAKQAELLREIKEKETSVRKEETAWSRNNDLPEL